MSKHAPVRLYPPHADTQFTPERWRGLEELEPRVLLSGVTLITHGFLVEQSLPAWVTSMSQEIANDIASENGGSANQVAQFRMAVTTGPVVSGWEFSGNFNPGGSASSYDLANSLGGEAVISLDWSEIAFIGQTKTQTVAQVASDYLLNNLGMLGSDLLASPIHLIGHSRGASLVGALAEDLGQAGLWVDQVTFLDTHPLAVPQDWGDNGITVPGNVTFADSYWRSDEVNPVELFDFDGEPVAGAHDINLDESALGGFTDPAYLNEHGDVHLWYHGTIDTVGQIADGEDWDNDGNANDSFNPDSFGWYSGQDGDGDARGPRDQIGYYFSRIVGGDRPTDGVGQMFGGAAPRVDITRTGSQWANIGAIEFTNNTTQYTIGEAVSMRFLYQDYDSNPVAELRLDTDRNPYNGDTGIQIFQQTLFDTNNNVWDWTLTWNTGDDPVSADEYYVYGRIADSIHTRYAYAVDTIELLDVVIVDPDAPTGVSATDGVYTDKVRITWDDLNQGEVGYDVVRNTANDVNTAQFLFSTSADNTTGDDVTAVPGQTYYYWVAARFNIGGQITLSPWSEPDTGFAGVVVTAPTGVSATDGAFPDMIRITWDDLNQGEVGYDVVRNTVNDVDTAQFLFSTSADNTTGDDVTAVPGQTYYYWVAARFNIGGQITLSPWSEPDTGFAGPILAGDRFEPNDTWQTATDQGTISAVRNETNLDIHDGDDEDWFKFTLAAPGNASSKVELFFTRSSGDINIRLFSDPNASPLRSSTSSSDNELICMDGLAAASYYLRVYVQGDTSNTYDLRITPAVVPDNEPVPGPNGHYYQQVVDAAWTWEGARLAAEAESRSFMGVPGHLATITSQEENDFVDGLSCQHVSPWIGGFQPSGSPEPDGNWQWVTGEPWSYTNWGSGEPNNDQGLEDKLQMMWENGQWNDTPPTWKLPAFIVEFEPLVGDLNGDGFVGISDLNTVLGSWNQSVPPGNPLGDPSGDGFVGIEDLNLVLGNWNAGTPPVATAIATSVSESVGATSVPAATGDTTDKRDRRLRRQQLHDARSAERGLDTHGRAAAAEWSYQNRRGERAGGSSYVPWSMRQQEEPVGLGLWEE